MAIMQWTKRRIFNSSRFISLGWLIDNAHNKTVKFHEITDN